MADDDPMRLRARRAIVKVRVGPDIDLEGLISELKHRFPGTWIFLLDLFLVFFRHDGAISKIREGALSLSMFGLMISPMVGIDLLIRFFK